MCVFIDGGTSSNKSTKKKNQNKKNSAKEQKMEQKQNEQKNVKRKAMKKADSEERADQNKNTIVKPKQTKPDVELIDAIKPETDCYINVTNFSSEEQFTVVKKKKRNTNQQESKPEYKQEFKDNKRMESRGRTDKSRPLHRREFSPSSFPKLRRNSTGNTEECHIIHDIVDKTSKDAESVVENEGDRIASYAKIVDSTRFDIDINDPMDQSSVTGSTTSSTILSSECDDNDLTRTISTAQSSIHTTAQTTIHNNTMQNTSQNITHNTTQSNTRNKEDKQRKGYSLETDFPKIEIKSESCLEEKSLNQPSETQSVAVEVKRDNKLMKGSKVLTKPLTNGYINDVDSRKVGIGRGASMKHKVTTKPGPNIVKTITNTVKSSAVISMEPTTLKTADVKATTTGKAASVKSKRKGDSPSDEVFHDSSIVIPSTVVSGYSFGGSPVQDVQNIVYESIRTEAVTNTKVKAKVIKPSTKKATTTRDSVIFLDKPLSTVVQTNDYTFGFDSNEEYCSLKTDKSTSTKTPPISKQTCVVLPTQNTTQNTTLHNMMEEVKRTSSINGLLPPVIKDDMNVLCEEDIEKLDEVKPFVSQEIKDFCKVPYSKDNDLNFRKGNFNLFEAANFLNRG